MRTNYLNLWLAASIFVVLFAPVISNQVVNALATTSTLTVSTQDLNGVAISGVYIQLYTNGKQIASGYSPATFIVNNTQMYTVVPNNYLTYIFDHWLDTGSTNSTRNISISSDTTVTAVYKTVTSPASVAPQSPTGLTATAVSSSQINLSWTAPSNNGGSAITGYKIERSTDGGTTWSTTVANTGSTATAYSDTGLTPSSTYTYRVSTINSVGTGSPSNTASATTFSATTVPQSPAGLAAVAGNSQVLLSWTAPSSNGGSAITGYNIYRSTSSGAETLLTTTENVTSYNDTSVINGQAYFYKVTAVNSVGESAQSNEANATPVAVATAPQPPTSLAASATSSSQINLSWTAPSNNGGSAITGYMIERSNNTGTTWSTVQQNTGSTATTYSDTSGLNPNSTYTYRVSAINSVGTSSPSNTASATTQSSTDTAVTLSPSRGPVNTTVSVTGTTFSPMHIITLAWDGSALTTNPSPIISSMTGGFSATFVVPNTAPVGSHKVTATDGTNTHSALFTVSASPTISLNTDTANVGTDVRITGANFAPKSQITISYDGAALDVGQQNTGIGSTTPLTITTDSNGNFVAIMSVLRSVTGTHTISAQDSTNYVSAQSITVTPHVFIYPTSGHAGSQVLIPSSQGNGFAANSDITIKFDGTMITPSTAIATDSEGNFGGSFTVPTTASLGNHMITISDAIGNTFSTSYSVTNSTTPTYSVQSIVTGMSLPDSFAFIPDNGPSVDGSGAIMVTEKNTGNVIVFKNSMGTFVRQSVPFVTIPNLQTGSEDNGVLGIAFDPNWITSKMVYFYVTRSTGPVSAPVSGPGSVPVSVPVVSEVIRYHATTDSAGNIVADTSVGEQLVLGNIPAYQDGHNGGHIKFDSQGNLYISTGDGWTFVAGQDLTTLQAKILRITPLAQPSNGQLYSIPPTNPFASSTNTSIKKEIWGYGVRNPFTFDIDSQTGKLYVSDVGFNTWERLENFTAAGANAGWPNYEAPPYGNPQNLASYMSQIYWFPHEGEEPQTGTTAGLQALTAGAFYHCSANCYPSNLQGAYFYGDYGVGFIAALLPSSTAPPTTDQASGYPIGQAVPIYYGLTEAPINMAVWNGKIYFLELGGNMDVLNYN